MFDSRTENYAMHMYGDEAYKLVENLADILRSKGHIVRLRDDLERGFGYTDVKEDKTVICQVGTKEIKENPNRSFPIHEAISPVVTCFHEVCGHGGQWKYEVYKDMPLSKVLLINDLSCRNSKSYYGLDEYDNPTRRYFDQPHELAAQYMALKMSHKYLSAVYGEEKATGMLTQYVNVRMMKDNEYISMPENVRLTAGNDYRGPFQMPTEPYKNLQEILDRFQNTFEQKVFETPDYKVPKDASDFVGQYIKKQDWPWERGNHRKQIENIPDHLTQAYVAASAWLNQKPGYEWVKHFPCFHDVTFHKKISDIIDEKIEPPEIIDLDLDQLTEDDIDFEKAVNSIKSDALNL